MSILIQMVRNLKRAVNHEFNQLAYNRQTLSSMGVPEVFQIELTNHCPMSCIMCPRTFGMTRTTGYMDTILYQHIIKEIAPLSSKIFLHHFGDSITHPMIGEFIRHASQNSLKTYLSTNPILLTSKRIKDLVDCGLHELVLSLDGITNDTVAKIRGKAAQNVAEAEKRILALIKYRNEQRVKTPSVILQFVRTKLNNHEAKAWLKKWINVDGIDAVKLKSFVAWDGREDRINDLRIEPPPESKVVCDKPWTSVTILWDGTVVPCCFDYDGLYVLGNLRDQSLRTICEEVPMRRLRIAHRDRMLDTIKLCSHCTDKEGYPTGKWYYPLNRIMSQHMPLGDEDYTWKAKK